MPILTIEIILVGSILRVSSCVDVLTQHFLKLMQEPVLGAHAKVGDSKKT